MIYALDRLVPQLADDVWVAPNAVVIGDVILAKEVSIWFGAVVRGDVERIIIGRGSNIQDNSVLHSDPGAPLTVGELVTVGHMVTLHGCTVGDGTLIGMGASVLNNARIGRNCLVGAQALITEGKEYPDGMLIVGSPARAIRPLTTQELERIAGNRQRYIERARRYREGLRPLP
ncbi:MAG: gamma carbonic anhydrase family protein [Gammaproteobacteria bacterium]|nr:gamma carbonic anhydrase family protein [Gammaproteobacteria bacterium]